MMSMVSPTSGNILGKPSSSSSSSSSSPATILGISPGKPPGLAMSGVGAAAIAASHLPKHPAFAHFLPLMSSLGLTHDGRQPQVISPLSPSSRPGSTSSPVNTPKRKRTLTPDKPANTPDSRRNNTSDLKISMQAMQPSVILTDLKEKKSKGSSSGSDSSCELSSVSKMLTATDAQNFQEYLTIPETEDEQDSMSVSEMSGEDSNLSMENMFSNSYVNFQRARIARLTDEATGAERKGAGGVDTPNTPEVVDDEDMAEEEEEDTRDGKTDMTLTVGMALLDGNSGHPDLGNKPLLLDEKLEGKHSDPSNMSEQEIARLIEKVTRENDGCPTKKKRNSYADSPHKFQCPYCPRCFPWMSSLNRHLLTHTGQKPFRCPRCPVTFSTKSNRERHLIRKHNVNMLDPSSRATMDRPYKCQLCVFSSFSTKSNLIKHYKDRHNGASPPQKALEALDGLDDLEGEDSNGKTCEEEEEEYALAQKLQENGLLHGFYQDSQDPCDSTLVSRDPHKKRNVLFDLSLIDGSKQDPNNALSTSSQNGDIVSNTSNNANSKDNNNNSSSNNNINNASSSNSNRNQSSSIARSSPSAFKHSSSSTTNLPGIDQTVLTDTVREFLDKSLQQSLEDSQRKALEEGSTFWITPAMERHLKRFDNGSNCGNGGVSTKATAASSASSSSSSPTSLPASLSLNCLHCNLEFPSKKKLQKHLKIHKPDNLPYSCHLCADNDEVTFASRVECLQHVSVAHRGEWRALEEYNGIRNVEVFATRLDKMVIKSIKRGKPISNEDKQDMTQVGKIMKRQDGDGESSDDIVNVFDDVKKEGEDDKNNKDIQDVDRAKKGGSGNNGSSPMKTTTSDAAKKVLCALCPDVFGSRAELKEHMCSHIGNRDSSLTQTSGLPDSNAAPKPSSSSSSSTPAAGTDDSDRVVTSGGDKGEDDGNLDMLHNLLGVESSTIDEIFEARVSAAAILGVAGGKTPAKP